ncbi:glycosyltransferase family 2 protein [Caldicellulosiruptoraceae bacterium PP1]
MIKIITIIIPNYNGYKYLNSCLNSLLNQTNNNYSIIIIDNNSNDKSIDIINSFKKNKLNIEILKLDKNYGFSVAVNNGIKMSDVEYVIALNNDTILDKDFVKNILHYVRNKSSIFSYSLKMIQNNNPCIIDDAGDYYTILGWHYKRGNGLPKEKYDKPYEIISSCGGAAIYNKKILDEIGYFDEDFFAYLEDVDLGLRALMRGYKNFYCPDAEVLHIGSATTGSKYNEFKVRLTSRNSIYVLYKNMPLFHFIINFPFIFLGYLIKLIFFTKKGFGKVYINGIKEGLTTLYKFKHKRKENMKKKKISNIKLEWYLVKSTAIFIYENLLRIYIKFFGK